MRERRMSAADLSRASGIEKGSISRYLSGKRKNASTDTVDKLARALRVSPVWLMGYDVDMTPAVPDCLTADGILIETQSADEIAFLNRYARADEKTKKIIRQLLDMEE